MTSKDKEKNRRYQTCRKQLINSNLQWSNKPWSMKRWCWRRTRNWIRVWLWSISSISRRARQWGRNLIRVNISNKSSSKMHYFRMSYNNWSCSWKKKARDRSNRFLITKKQGIEGRSWSLQVLRHMWARINRKLKQWEHKAMLKKRRLHWYELLKAPRRSPPK